MHVISKTGATKREIELNDEKGQPLHVSEALEGVAYNSAKHSTYIRAIKAWNIIDKSSTRQRITVPLPIAMFASASSSSERAIDDTDKSDECSVSSPEKCAAPGSLMARWDADSVGNAL